MTHGENKESIVFRSRHEARFVFFLVFVGVLSLTYGIFFAIDFLPEKPGTTETVRGVSESDTRVTVPLSDDVDTHNEEPATSPEDVEVTPPTGGPTQSHMSSAALSPGDIYPTKITFDALGGRSVVVLNPESRSTEALDAALLKGVVRHPDSADFERTGTIFLFGHSSYLPNVMNKNFQAFNGIQNMSWGDIIRLESQSREYIYRVDRVYEVSATDAEVKIETGKAKLTLVTCDSFGAKSDRFVVEATLIEETDRNG